jgi:hypothetical protein
MQTIWTVNLEQRTAIMEVRELDVAFLRTFSHQIASLRREEITW